MEKELNIAAILKEKSKGLKLWSPIVGGCTFKGISSENGVIVASFIDKEGDILEWDFGKDGRTLSAPKEAEVCLFPSKKMRDWEKFAWKKGDVLYNAGLKEYCVFNKFITDDYLMFISKYNFDEYVKSVVAKTYDPDKNTAYYEKVSDEKAAEIISLIEEFYGGKLNLETLEIEKQPEFKDGDIVFVKGIEGYKDYIEIFSHFYDGENYNHVEYDIEDAILDCSGKYPIGKDEYQDIRLATDSEKQQLFDALAKENKAWDSEKKMVVDLPKKCEFEPFQKVLVRCKDYQKWKVDFFSHYDDSCKGFPYVCVSSRKSFCIPYNDQTKHLLGTNKEW